jgi:hypothetical protein
MVLERFKQGPPRKIKFEPPCHLLIRLTYLYLYIKKIFLWLWDLKKIVITKLQG